MKEPEKSIWTRDFRDHAGADSILDLAENPPGGMVKRWLAGVLVAAVPAVYGICCIQRGHTTLPGKSGRFLDATGPAGFWLAVSYISIGVFIHFHYFWGLGQKLGEFSSIGKTLSLLVFLSSFLYAVFLIIGNVWQG